MRTWSHIDGFIQRIYGVARKIPLGSLHAEENPKHHQYGAAPRGAQGHPAAKRAKHRRLFQNWRPHQIVKILGKFAATLWKQHASGIQPVSILREESKKALQILFFGELRVARGANGEVLLNQSQ